MDKKEIVQKLKSIRADIMHKEVEFALGKLNKLTKELAAEVVEESTGKSLQKTEGEQSAKS